MTEDFLPNRVRLSGLGHDLAKIISQNNEILTEIETSGEGDRENMGFSLPMTSRGGGR